jgi:hypothetical protein
VVVLYWGWLEVTVVRFEIDARAVWAADAEKGFLFDYTLQPWDFIPVWDRRLAL